MGGPERRPVLVGLHPAPQGMTSVEAESTVPKTIPFVPFIGGSGPNPLIITRGLIPALLGLPSAAPALNAVNLEVPAATETTHIIGAPELTLTYSGIGNARNVYAQIVDDTTHLVLGNLATPIPVDLDGQTHTVTYSLEQVAQTLEPGQSVTVQIVTSTFNFLNFYSWGTITVEGMSVKLPTLGAAAVAALAAASPLRSACAEGGAHSNFAAVGAVSMRPVDGFSGAQPESDTLPSWRGSSSAARRWRAGRSPVTSCERFTAGCCLMCMRPRGPT